VIQVPEFKLAACSRVKLATLIISSLEGAVMVYRLERNEEALRAVQSHLNSYLETEVRVLSK
jgi:hypothetical protein